MGFYSETVAPEGVISINNTCTYGYVTNNSTTTAGIFILYAEHMANITKTLQPGQSFYYSNVYFYKFANLGTIDLVIVFSDTPFSISESPYSMRMFEPVDINGTVNVNISTSSIDMPVAVQGTVDVNLSASSITMPVSVAGTIDVNISTSSINMPVTVQGTANVYITETIDLPIAVSPSTNNGLSGTISTTGTAQAFTTTSTLVLHFQFKNNSKTNTMSLGTATVQSITLFPQSMFLWDSATGEQQDISTWYVVGTSGDTFAVTYQE